MPSFNLPRILVLAFLYVLTASATTAQTSATGAPPSFSIESASVTRQVRQSRTPRISEFSGLPVPRYASLKYDEVNGRGGPGTNYPIKWVYRRQGLPVMVVRESREWAKVRDPQGDEVWVHQRLLAARRTGITATSTTISQHADTAAPLVAAIDMGVVIDIADCTGEWCRAHVKDISGWTPRASIWGADALE